jgi:hypothetical protein
MKRRWKKFLAGVLSAALALNLAAPLALAGSSTIGAACSVTSVFLYPEYVGRVDGENVSCIQGEVSYDHGLLTFHGDVTLTTVGVADFGTVPLVKALSEKNLRLVANGKVTGRTKGNGIEEAKEIAGGEYDLTYADLGRYSDTKPKGILGGDTGTTITAGTTITLKDFHTGIAGGNVQIDGTVNITGAQFQGATYGIANSTTMNPGSELEIHADRYIGKDCLLTYNGGHLLMIVAENGDGNNIVQGRLSIGNDVSKFWYRTGADDAYTEINVNENFENFTAAIGRNQDYLELTDVDPDPQESYLAYWVVRPGDDPVATMQIPGPITSSEEEARLFEGWFLEDGTRLEDSPYYMGPGADHVGNLDRDVTFYGHWRTAESGEGSPDGGDGFGTLLAGVAVVGVVGVVAYQVGTEFILDQLLPTGVAVPHTRAELAMLLWNTAGRPAPATLPAFADVADPELAQAAQWAIEQGYLKARADGSFKPDKGVAKWRVIRGYRAVTEP